MTLYGVSEEKGEEGFPRSFPEKASRRWDPMMGALVEPDDLTVCSLGPLQSVVCLVLSEGSSPASSCVLEVQRLRSCERGYRDQQPTDDGQSCPCFACIICIVAMQCLRIRDHPPRMVSGCGRARGPRSPLPVRFPKRRLCHHVGTPRWLHPLRRRVWLQRESPQDRVVES